MKQAFLSLFFIAAGILAAAQENPAKDTSIVITTINKKLPARSDSLTIESGNIYPDQKNLPQNYNSREIEYKPNYIGGYLGIFEWNLNYERNIFQRKHSYTNLRFGFGFWEDEPTDDAFGGNYLNASLVHLIGKRTAHFELIMGIKYFITRQDEIIHLWGYKYMPDIYFGYRHEKPDGKFFLRFGINVPTLVNLGMGFKF